MFFFPSSSSSCLAYNGDTVASTAGAVSENVDFPLTEVNILLGAEITRDGHAVEVAERFDHVRILNGPHVQQQDERGEQDGGKRQRDADQDQLAPTVVHAHRDKRQECVGEQSARNEPNFELLFIYYSRTVFKKKLKM